jgi:hypothetical protein
MMWSDPIIERARRRGELQVAAPVPEDALAYLRQVYRDPLENTHVRMRAAQIAIEYERPRLAVTAVLSGEDYADRLERAIAASGVRPKMIEASPQAGIRRRV